MCLDFAYPGKYNVYQVEHEAYTRFVGPDNPQDDYGVTREVMQKFFDMYHVGTINMDAMVDAALADGNFEPLHAEISAQNRQGVIQMMSVADESLLINDANGQSLHPGLHYGHCIVRLGFSDDAGYGLYFDPANPLACTNPVTHKYEPVKISWDSMVRAKVNFCYAIMPPGVKPPPAGFSYQHGTWPVPPKPPLDVDKAQSTIAAMINAMDALKGAIGNLGNDLNALKTEV